MNGQPETVELYDRSHQTKAKAQAWRISALFGPIETPQDRLPLLLADAAISIDDAHDDFTVAAYQFNVPPPTFWGKLDGIADEVGDRLKQEVPVAAHVKPMLRLDPQIDPPVLRDRLVHIANLPHHFLQTYCAQSPHTHAV